MVHWDRQSPGIQHDRADRLVDLYASGEQRSYGPLFLQRKMNISNQAFTEGDFSLTISDLQVGETTERKYTTLAGVAHLCEGLSMYTQDSVYNSVSMLQCLFQERMLNSSQFNPPNDSFSVGKCSWQESQPPQLQVPQQSTGSKFLLTACV